MSLDGSDVVVTDDVTLTVSSAMLMAHSPAGNGRWHGLAEHLEAVGRLAAGFAGAFGSSVAAEIVGQAHDLGKADPAWQAYLSTSVAGHNATSVDHKTAGAFLLSDWGLAGLGPLVVGHHGGIPNFADVKQRIAGPRTLGQVTAIRRADDLGLIKPDVTASDLVPPGILPSSAADLVGKRRFEFWLRMVFSTLIDADRLDTATHFDPARLVDLNSASLTSAYEAFEASRATSLADRRLDSVAGSREDVFAQVVGQASAPRGWFELTAPTGSGKTLAALGFALRHARANQMRRVITAVPFISVTEQVADVYRQVLDPLGRGDVVVEHHSGLRTRSEAQAGEGLWSRLAIENWDASVVVTTTVRLLESLFDNHPTGVRRLHRVAGSVIVLDEVQSLPWRLLEPTLEVLRDLVRHYGCSVVLSTATQPPLHKVGSLDGVSPVQLLQPTWFATFRRVEARYDPEPRSWEAIADRLLATGDAHGGRFLAVLNTVKDAKALASQLVGRDGVVHLSTRLCPAHRRRVLAEIHVRLRDGRPCGLVSTQLIEAGVDVDFPTGMRAIGPMPAIAQVAGRINRHGRVPLAQLHVVEPVDGRAPPDEYTIGLRVTRDLLQSGVDPLDPASMNLYFDRFLDATRSLLDKELIQRERELHNFANVADRYRIIADDTTAVVVSYGGFDATRIKLAHEAGERRRQIRRLQPYMVSLRTREFEAAVKSGSILDLGNGLCVWLGGYDGMFGLTTERSMEALIW